MGELCFFLFVSPKTSQPPTVVIWGMQRRSSFLCVCNSTVHIWRVCWGPGAAAVHTGHRGDPAKLIFGLEAEPLINNISFSGGLVPRPVSSLWQTVLSLGLLESCPTLKRDALLSWRANDKSYQTKGEPLHVGTVVSSHLCERMTSNFLDCQET